MRLIVVEKAEVGPGNVKLDKDEHSDCSVQKRGQVQPSHKSATSAMGRWQALNLNARFGWQAHIAREKCLGQKSRINDCIWPRGI